MLIPVLGMEEWRKVPGFAGYEVSSYGGVRTYRPANGKGSLQPEPRTINPRSIAGKPYLRVKLTNAQGHQVDRKVHALVLLAFVGPRPTKQHKTRHLDGDHVNNRLDNLMWRTPQENADDRIAHGTQLRGACIAKAVLTEKQVQEIKQEIPNWKRGLTSEFSHKFGVARSTISSVRNGQTWGHI